MLSWGTPYWHPHYRYDLRWIGDVLKYPNREKPSAKARVHKFLMARSVEDRRVLCHALGIPLSLDNKPLL